MRRFFLIAAVLALTGCASAPPAPPVYVSPEDTELAYTPLICDGAQQCSVYWKRAQFWVVGASSYRIQIATDSLIETYNPPKFQPGWGFRIVRVPLDGLRERIVLTPKCEPASGCDAALSVKVAANFKRSVIEGVKP